MMQSNDCVQFHCEIFPIVRNEIGNAASLRGTVDFDSMVDHIRTEIAPNGCLIKFKSFRPLVILVLRRSAKDQMRTGTGDRYRLFENVSYNMVNAYNVDWIVCIQYSLHREESIFPFLLELLRLDVTGCYEFLFEAVDRAFKTEDVVVPTCIKRIVFVTQKSRTRIGQDLIWPADLIAISELALSARRLSDAREAALRVLPRRLPGRKIGTRTQRSLLGKFETLLDRERRRTIRYRKRLTRARILFKLCGKCLATGCHIPFRVPDSIPSASSIARMQKTIRAHIYQHMLLRD